VIIPTGTGALITDPALVRELDAVLTEPLHLQPPALRHFIPDSGGSSPAGLLPFGGAVTASVGTAPGSLEVLPGLLLSTLLVLAALGVVGTAVRRTVLMPRLRGDSATHRARRLRIPRPRLTVRPAVIRVLPMRMRTSPMLSGSIGAVLVAAVVSASIVVPKALPHASSNSPVIAGTLGAGPDAGRPVSVATPQVRATDSWRQLVAIEDAVVVRQRQLTVEEDRISSIADASSVHLEPPLRASGADRRTAGVAVLETLLQAHEQTVNAYHDSLQHEYDFYISVTQDPAVRDAVTRAAAASTDIAVVTYDLQQVSTQLQQQAAITAAQNASSAHVQQQLARNAAAPKFTAPVGGYVSQGFGSTSLALEPSISYEGVFYVHFHTGIDIANVLETPVVAAAPGRVILATTSRDPSGNLTGYGNYVVIEHADGYLTLYGHLDKLVAATGQLVQRGQEIGLLGSTGWSTGPHLHFEVRQHGGFLDPETLLGRAVRP
jgi:murein DD-endopeptidase MepM/ murein hydrolase activator NlpD